MGADLGTWQTGTLYLTYSLSAVTGAPYLVQRLGSRNGILAGLVTYCIYVTAFLIASLVPDETKWPVTILGAAIGGIGGGMLWTAQGKYFVSVSAAYAYSARISTPAATSYLGGLFAFFYLYEEVLMKVLVSVIIESESDSDDSNAWLVVFTAYTVISMLACLGVLQCYKFPLEIDPSPDDSSLCFRFTSATRILFADRKMKYMVPLNAAFGAASGFTIAFVSGQVVHASGKDEFIGALTAVPPAVAAILSLALGRIGQRTGKGPILIAGNLAFAAFAGAFLLSPGLNKGWAYLILVYERERASARGCFFLRFVVVGAGGWGGVHPMILMRPAMCLLLTPRFARGSLPRASLVARFARAGTRSWASVGPPSSRPCGPPSQIFSLTTRTGPSLTLCCRVV